MKVKLKTSLYDSKGIHTKGEVLEIETAAFNPMSMVEIPEVRAVKKPVEDKSIEQTEPKKKTTKKKV